MNKAIPKLLVATEFPPNAPGGGPAVVRQMLKCWPLEKIYWWSCSPEGHTSFGQQVASHEVATIPSRLYPQRRGRALKSFFLQHAWKCWASRQLRNTLDKLQPDIVWMIPHGWSIPVLGDVFLGNKNFRFHVSLHDYVNSRNYAVRYGERCAEVLARTADQLYARALSRDAISKPMLADLLSRTGLDGALRHAGVEENEFANFHVAASRNPDVIRIAYAGTVVVEKTFEMIVAALNTIRAQSPSRMTLEFFSNETYASRSWFNRSWMHMHRMLPHDELTLALREFTWGLAPMSLFDDDPHYNRFSLPTKFVSYLAAALPIIIVGHPDSSLLQIGKHYNLGGCLTVPKHENLVSGLAATLSIKEPHSEFRAEIERCARTEFDAARMRATLYRQLCKDAGPPGFAV